MSSLGSPNPFFIAGKKAYEVERSVRFVKGDYHRFTRTPSSEGDRKTWTWSAWIKRGSIGNRQILFSADNNATNATYIALEFQADDNFRCLGGTETQGSQITKETQMVFRDTSAWYHLVFVLDATNSIARLYVNNSEVTDWNTNNNPTNQNYQINATTQHFLGRYGSSLGSSASNYFDGYMAEVNFIDGQAYDPSYFGETDAVTGQWNPKKYTGSYGTNGFYLNFSDNSGTTATTLGKDYSGNGNNFTPNNFSVAAGAGNDSLEDTPTNNFSTINPLAGYSTNFEVPSNGNLDFSLAQHEFAMSSFEIPSSGKWYAEVLFTTAASGRIGISNPNRMNEGTGGTQKFNGIDNLGGSIRVDGSTVQTGILSRGDGDITGISVDRDAGTVSFTVNGSASGTAVNISSMNDSSQLVFRVGRNSSSGSAPTGSINFGQRPFSYLPTGFKALCSANLPDPTIKLPNKHFDTLLYTGDGNDNKAISGLSFQPDWIWAKKRGGNNSAEHHWLVDVVRGVTKHLSSSLADSEYTFTNVIKSFTSNGFTLGTDGKVNRASDTYVAWNWNAGDTDGKTYTVTVVSDSGNKYRFDGFGTSAVTLDLAEGGTYIFNYPSAHPFRFSTTSDGTHGGGSEYTTGVVVNSSTQVQITVAASAPTLYYYCTIHSGMGGQVNTNSTLGSSNFDGTIQNTVKANTTAGFSIVTWTGNGSSGSTLGHGLGVAPKAIITKQRNSSGSWATFHNALGTGSEVYLDLTQQVTNSNFWVSSPTSSVFTVSGADYVNENTSTYVAYCFSEVAGYSKFGSYTGNGSTDGTFVFTGFRPSWVLIKRTDNVGNWWIHDAQRNTFNVVDNYLYADTNAAEASFDNLDFLSNGFKLRVATYQPNTSGGTFIYLAFAESPFKNARAR